MYVRRPEKSEVGNMSQLELDEVLNITGIKKIYGKPIQAKGRKTRGKQATVKDKKKYLREVINTPEFKQAFDEYNGSIIEDFNDEVISVYEEEEEKVPFSRISDLEKTRDLLQKKLINDKNASEKSVKIFNKSSALLDIVKQDQYALDMDEDMQHDMIAAEVDDIEVYIKSNVTIEEMLSNNPNDSLLLRALGGSLRSFYGLALAEDKVFYEAYRVAKNEKTGKNIETIFAIEIADILQDKRDDRLEIEAQPDEYTGKLIQISGRSIKVVQRKSIVFGSFLTTYMIDPRLESYENERLIEAGLYKILHQGKNVILEVGDDYHGDIEELLIIEEANFVDIKKNETKRLGFFEKIIPSELKQKFHFNCDEDHLYCVFSSLYYDDPRFPELSLEQAITCIHKSGILLDLNFRIYKHKLRSILHHYCMMNNLSVKLTVYNIRDDQPFDTKIKSLSREKYTIGKESDDPISKKICIYRGHIFNCNIKGSIAALMKIHSMYDELDKKPQELIDRVSKKSVEAYRAQIDGISNEDILAGITNDNIRDFYDFEAYSKPAAQEQECFIFDLETYIDTQNDRQYTTYSNCLIPFNDKKPILFTYIDRSTPRDTHTLKVFKDMLDYLNKNKTTYLNAKGEKKYKTMILFAHNMSCFDGRIIIPFVLNTDGVSNYHECTSGNILISIEFLYYGVPVSIRDSLKLLYARVDRLPTDYGVNSVKLKYPHEIYNNLFDHGILDKARVNEFRNSIDLSQLADKTQKALVAGVMKIKDDEKFLMDYCKVYNYYDCQVVKEALIKFDQMLGEVAIIKRAGLSILESRTLPSFVYKLCQASEVFDGVPVVKDELKHFIAQSISGGRVMCFPQEYQSKNYDRLRLFAGAKVTEKDTQAILDMTDDCIVDFDGVSLYPSAIYKSPGFPAGDIRMVESLEDIKMCLAENKRFFICCSFTTRKDIKIPICSEYVDGKRHYHNGSFNNIIIDDITLADLMKYQDVQINDIQLKNGIYFEQTSNKFSMLMRQLFDLRAKYKREGSRVEQVIKLINNSSFGRTILKDRLNNTVYVKNEELANFVADNYDSIRSYEPRGKFYKVNTLKRTMKSKGYHHFGSHILSVSKSIMNKVFYELNYNIFYTDTDSIHITKRQLEDVLTRMPDLVGKDMGQFHSDFQVGGGKAIGKDIFSIRSVFCQKKVYYDELLYIAKDKDGVERYAIDTHKKAKGVPSDFMNYERYKSLLKEDSEACELTVYKKMMIRQNKKGIYAPKSVKKILYFQAYNI